MFLPTVSKSADSSAAYEAMHIGLQQAINTINTHWYRSIQPDIANKLNDSLLRQDKAAGLLSVNMDEELATMLDEVRWPCSLLVGEDEQHVLIFCSTPCTFNRLARVRAPP